MDYLAFFSILSYYLHSRHKNVRGSTPLPPTKAPPWACWKVYSAFRPQPLLQDDFVIILHEIQHLKTQPSFKN